MNGSEVTNKGMSVPRITPQIIFGLVVTVVGILFTLDNLGIAQVAGFARYWPTGLILVGAVKLWQSRDGKGGALAGLIFIIGGSWLLLEELAVLRLSFSDLWPLLLVGVGAYLVWKGATTPPPVPPPMVDVGDGPIPVPGVISEAEAGNSTFTAVAILGGVTRGSTSKAFRKATLVAVLGGLEIDLRHAEINGEASIDVFALWGGIEIRVPEDWTVDSQVIPILGGVEDKTRPTRVANHRLIVRGSVVMAGVEIKN